MTLRNLSAAALAGLLLALVPRQAGASARRVAERGPPTLLIGVAFTVSAPLGLMSRVARGRAPALPACRLGHGLKMTAAGALLLPAGLLLAPFHFGRLPAAWMDTAVDAAQEDYCTRPFMAVLP